MSSARSPESIFEAARKLVTPAEQAAYLDAACAENAPLRQRVEQLLAAFDQGGSFLESPAPLGVDRPRLTGPAADPPNPEH